MTDPSFELAAAIIGQLKADAGVSALVGGRVFDRVPERQDGEADVVSPYISLGPASLTSEDADCIEGYEISQQVDCWSWGHGEAYGSAEVRKIGHAVRRALTADAIALESNALATFEHQLTRIIRDPDGITNHGVIQFVAIVETP